MIRKQSASEDPGGMPHVNVLLIEDDPGDARLIMEMLAESKSAVFNMELANRLSTGLAHLAGGNVDFDVILLDLSLPDSSGIDTFVRISAQAQNAPIVVLTGLYDTGLAILAVQKGAQDYLVKGQVSSEIVVRAIRYAIERNRAEAHIKHLNSVLKAIRNVNQLIATATERDSLLWKSCDALVDARGYDAVWLGLLEDGERFVTVAGSGFPDDVSRFRRNILDGNYPPCIRDALAMEATVQVRDRLRECGKCFFDDACLGKEAVIARVEHAGSFYGLLAVLLAPGVAVDYEEKRLLAGVASDIGIALHNLEMKEERGRAEGALKESDARLRMVVENMPVMLDAFDDKGNVVTWNSECEKVTGFNSREIINNPGAGKILYPNQDCKNYIHSRGGAYGGNFRNLEWDITCKDGSVRTILWSNISEKYPIPGWHSWAIGFDITERRKAEEQIKRSLHEKEVLLREIHHRVKNNLQVVSSLLNMQARVASDPDTINALLESYDRINAMALIHTQLYESANLSEINMNNFVCRLMGQLFRSRQIDGARIMYTAHITDHPLPISIALPMGLIINELLTNALKHAFGNECAGTVEVTLTRDDGAADAGTVRLTVRDNGVGVPEGFNINESKTVGLRLVKILVEDQLQGTLDIIRDRGTTFDIEFGIGI